MFEHKLLDMMEFGVLNYKPCSEFKVPHANSIPSFGRGVLTSLESRGDSWLTTPPDLLWRLIRHPLPLPIPQNPHDGFLPLPDRRNNGT